MPQVSTQAGGTCIAFPDVCLVPSAAGPIPTPFPNSASCSDAEGTAENVLIGGSPAIVVSSTIPMSTGDEPGTGGGVISGVFRGPVQFKTGSAKFFAGGKRVVLMGAATAHNGTNANAPLGQQVSPSQSKVTASQ